MILRIARRCGVTLFPRSLRRAATWPGRGRSPLVTIKRAPCHLELSDNDYLSWPIPFCSLDPLNKGAWHIAPLDRNRSFPWHELFAHSSHREPRTTSPREDCRSEDRGGPYLLSAPRPPSARRSLHSGTRRWAYFLLSYNHRTSPHLLLQAIWDLMPKLNDCSHAVDQEVMAPLLRKSQTPRWHGTVDHTPHHPR